MQTLVNFLFLLVFSLDAMHRYGLVSRQFTLLPEIISIITLLIVILYGARHKEINLRIAYVAILGLIAVHIMFGVILNSVQAGPLVTGIRAYLKYIPFFLLPIVYRFTPAQLRRQLQLVLMLALLQLPVAIYQRFVESSGQTSGDMIRGTLETSGHLSIFLVSTASMWIAFHFRAPTKRPLRFWVVLLLLLLPTTLNETKGTLILLPIALIAPALLDTTGSGRIKQAFISVAVLAAFLAIFVPVYDHFMAPRWGYGIMDFFTMEGRVEKYLIKSDSVEAEKGGKVGSWLIASRELATDPAKFVFGLGIGNVSESFLGEQYTGEYYNKYGHLIGATVGLLVWEIGWMGVLLMFIMYYLIFKDAMRVKTSSGVIGSFGLGWMSVVLVIAAALFYKEITRANSISYLFWYFSGYIVATAVRMRKSEKHPLVSHSDEKQAYAIKV